MYFGSNDVILDRPDLRDDQSCALDIVDTQLCTQNKNSHTKGDFSSQSLIPMIKWVTKKEFTGSHDTIEYHSWARLVIFQFIQRVLKIESQYANHLEMDSPMQPNTTVLNMIKLSIWPNTTVKNERLI